MRRWRIEYNQDEKLEEGIGDCVRPTNTSESQVENIHDGCKISNDVRCRDTG